MHVVLSGVCMPVPACTHMQPHTPHSNNTEIGMHCVLVTGKHTLHTHTHTRLCLHPSQSGERAVAMVNNLGATTSLEMNCMTMESLTQLKARGVSHACHCCSSCGIACKLCVHDLGATQGLRVCVAKFWFGTYMSGLKFTRMHTHTRICTHTHTHTHTHTRILR